MKRHTKRKTTRQIVESLRNDGHIVETRTRKDGGVTIVSIDGQRFGGSAGNTKAREMTGQRLSRKQITQRQRNARNRRQKPLPKTLQKQIRKTRKAMKKTNTKTTIETKNVRKAYGKRGYHEVMYELKKQERYARGYAYIENIYWFIDRLREVGMYKHYSFEDVITKLNRRIMKIKDATLMKMYRVLYPCEQGQISPTECENQLNAIIDSEIK